MILFFIFIFWLCRVAFGILVSQPGVEPVSLTVRVQRES